MIGGVLLSQSAKGFRVWILGIITGSKKLGQVGLGLDRTGLGNTPIDQSQLNKEVPLGRVEVHMDRQRQTS